MTRLVGKRDVKTPWDKKTLLAVRRWLRREALLYSRRRERYQAEHQDGTRDQTMVVATAMTATALRQMADLILEKMERAK